MNNETEISNKTPEQLEDENFGLKAGIGSLHTNEDFSAQDSDFEKAVEAGVVSVTGEAAVDDDDDLPTLMVKQIEGSRLEIPKREIPREDIVDEITPMVLDPEKVTSLNENDEDGMPTFEIDPRETPYMIAQQSKLIEKLQTESLLANARLDYYTDFIQTRLVSKLKDGSTVLKDESVSVQDIISILDKNSQEDKHMMAILKQKLGVAMMEATTKSARIDFYKSYMDTMTKIQNELLALAKQNGLEKQADSILSAYFHTSEKTEN